MRIGAQRCVDADVAESTRNRDFGGADFGGSTDPQPLAVTDANSIADTEPVAHRV